MCGSEFASWIGFYIAGNVGGTWSDVDWSNISLTDERFNKNTSGFIGGGQIGYNQQFGNIVLGVGATVSGVDLSQRLPLQCPNCDLLLRYQYDCDDDGPLRHRRGSVTVLWQSGMGGC